MTITVDTFFSWPVAGWFAAGALTVAFVWLATARVQIIWQRVFLRAAVIALCFAPLPALQMFAEGALPGSVAITPLWYALFWSLWHGAIVAAIVTLFIWVVMAYLLWVAGMSISYFVRVRARRT